MSTELPSPPGLSTTTAAQPGGAPDTSVGGHVVGRRVSHLGQPHPACMQLVVKDRKEVMVLGAEKTVGSCCPGPPGPPRQLAALLTAGGQGRGGSAGAQVQCARRRSLGPTPQLQGGRLGQCCPQGQRQAVPQQKGQLQGPEPGQASEGPCEWEAALGRPRRPLPEHTGRWRPASPAAPACPDVTLQVSPLHGSLVPRTRAFLGNTVPHARWDTELQRGFTWTLTWHDHVPTNSRAQQSRSRSLTALLRPNLPLKEPEAED